MSKTETTPMWEKKKEENLIPPYAFYAPVNDFNKNIQCRLFMWWKQDL